MTNGKKGCHNCKYGRTLPSRQPCRFCINEGYVGYPLWEPEELKE